MKKRDESLLSENILLTKEQGDGSPGKTGGEKRNGEAGKGNIYTDAINSLMEKNRKRVSTYYCANLKCTSSFWGAEHGYRCPKCGSLGIISTFKADSAEKDPHGHIVGFIDTVGRIFCNECAERFRLGDDTSMIIYSDSEPYRHENCEVCRAGLTIPS